MIFVDPTGQRWRNVKHTTRAVTLALGLPVAAVLAGATLHQPHWSPFAFLTPDKPSSFLSTARELLAQAPTPSPTPTPTSEPTRHAAQVLGTRTIPEATSTPTPPEPTPTPFQTSSAPSETASLSETGSGTGPAPTEENNKPASTPEETPPESPGNSDFGHSHQDSSPGNSEFGRSHRPTP